MSNNILRFADLGEATTRRILAGWCGPLVPEPPTSEHDHRKHRLMYMDCTSPDTVEGHVLTFTYSQWSRGTELVFEDGTPRGVGADVAVGRRALSWETCWRWIQSAGMDCERPEVAARLAGLCAQALMGRLAGTVHVECGIQPEIRLGFVWGPPIQVALTAWTHDGRCVAGRGPRLHPPRRGQYGRGEFLVALTLALAPKIAALP